MVKKGETILVEKPFAFVLKSTLRTERCNHCFALTRLQKCSQCHYIYYCSKTCQKLSWSMHKLECARLKNIKPKVLPDSAHLLTRVLLRIKTNGTQERTEYKNEKSRTFADLMTHSSEVKKDKRRMEHFMSILMLVRILFHDDEEMVDECEVFDIYCKMCINSFNILDNDMNSIGTGIYLAASILDHSCEPNAVAVFEGTTIYIRTIRNVSDCQWSNVRISYIDVLNTTDHRRRELETMYYFLCDCKRCLNEEEKQLMDAMACAREKCPGYIFVTDNCAKVLTCNRCQLIVSKKRLEQFHEVTQLADYHILNMKSKDMALHDASMTSVIFTDEAAVNVSREISSFNYIRFINPRMLTYGGMNSSASIHKYTETEINNAIPNFLEDIDVCELTLKKQKQILHEFNVRKIKTLDLAFEASINLERWDDALQYGLELLPGFSKYYKDYHPLVGLLNMKLLKLMLLKEEFIKAKKFYNDAKEILLISHGYNHSLYTTLQQIFCS